MTDPLLLVREIAAMIDTAKAARMTMTVEALRFALFVAQEDAQRLARPRSAPAD
jgi:hypothetical protein